MPSLKETAVLLGVSTDSLKRRLAAARELGCDGIVRDAKTGALVISEQTVALLQRALVYERMGLAMRAALEKALSDGHGEAPDGAGPLSEGRTGSSETVERSSVRTEELNLQLIRLLWVLTGILGVGVAGMLTATFLLALRR